MASNFERLVEKRAIRASRDPYPFATFREKWSRSGYLMRHAERAVGSNKRKISSESRRQCIISLVTAFEVYLSDIVLELVDKRGLDVTNEERFKKLLDGKYNFFDIHRIIKDKITLGEIVCEHVNFQNVAYGFSFLSALFNLKFQEMIAENKFSYNNATNKKVTVTLRRDFPKHLERVLKLRHSYVHDVKFGGTPSLSRVVYYRRLIMNLVLCIDVKADSFRGVTTSVIIKK